MLRKLTNPRKPRRIFRTVRENSRNPVVLIVERDRLLRWALYEVLCADGFRVITAPAPASAVWLLDRIEQDVHLAIVDDDSWAMTAQTRATLQRRWPALPIIVTMSADDPAVAARARKHGAAELLIKPFEL